MSRHEQAEREHDHDLVVFSDLHLGEGFQEHLARYSPMEDFFHDEAFARLLDQLRGRYAEDPSRLVVVLNGDVFDFLTVTRVPDDDVCRELDLDISAAERRFGLNPTPEKSVYKLDLIMDGHKPFFSSLARMVAAGHRVEILRGNHDLEIYFEQVQDRFMQRLSGYTGGPTPEQVRRRVRFHQWFYLEPGRLYLEHGNQYEASNSIRYPLRPVLPPRRWGRRETLIDYPLGSLFVRYFYNRVHHMNPYVPKVISFEQYLEFIRRYNLLDLLRIAREHYSFFMAALRPATATGRSRASQADNARQEEDFAELEQTTRPGDLHRHLNQLKVHPMAASKLALTRQMVKPVARRVLVNGSLAFVAFYLWLLIFNAIQTPEFAGSVFTRAALLFFFSLVTALLLVWMANHLGRKLQRNTDESVETCADRADRIARLTGVKLVLMGHTHVVDYRRVADGRAVYANSGSWVAVDNPWDRLVPDARRLTFQYVQGEKVRICRWNDDAERIDPVPLFNLSQDRGRARCPPVDPGQLVEGRERSWRRRAAYREDEGPKPPS